MNHLIIGNGIAGITAATTIRQNDPNAKITVFTDEFHPFGLYARKDLARKLGDGINSPDDFLIHSADDLQKMGIELVFEPVEKIAPKIKQLVFKKGVRYAYDRLLIASGATPKNIDAPGNHLMGVHQFRDFDDTSLIEAWRPDLQEYGVVVIGGGILGLDLCYSFRRRDIPVTLIVRDSYVGQPLLSELTSQCVMGRLKATGVKVIRFTTVTAFERVDGVVLDAVKLSTGKVIPTRMAICAIGVRPKTGFLDGSGIELSPVSDFDPIGGAILVNEHLETNIPDIYAAGNCASIEGMIAHNWKTSQEQGRIAGLNMLGETASFAPDLITDFDTQIYDLPFAYFWERDSNRGERFWGVSGSDMEGGWDVWADENQTICGAILIGKYARFAEQFYESRLSGDQMTDVDMAKLMGLEMPPWM